MKILLIAIVLLTQSLANGQGVLLSSGDSYVFQFSSLSYLRPAQSDSGSLSVQFAQGTFSDTSSALVEVFPNTLSDTPDSFTGSGSSSPLDTVWLVNSWRSGFPPFWGDLQGIVRVTMLSGSGDLTGFAVTQVVSGGYYSQSFPVPEPSTAPLLAIGLACLIAFKTRKKSPPNKSLEPTAVGPFSSAFAVHVAATAVAQLSTLGGVSHDLGIVKPV